jgi:hypothetical protein
MLAPGTRELPWGGLSASQREAAGALGYQPDSWPAHAKDALGWEPWLELPVARRAAWRALGVGKAAYGTLPTFFSWAFARCLHTTAVGNKAIDAGLGLRQGRARWQVRRRMTTARSTAGARRWCAPGLRFQGGQGVLPAPLACQVLRLPTHFPWSLHAI